MIMKTLMSANTDYILAASLESLHAESMNWRSDLAFWGDELVFFYKLLKAKELGRTFPPLELADAEKELMELNSHWLVKMRNDVDNHEKQLAIVLNPPLSLADEEVFRETHGKLLLEMIELENQIRSFKRKLFRSVEQYNA